MLDRKTEAQGRVDGLRQELIKLGQLRKANKIVSPIDGEVQQLAVHTIGGVLQPAQALMVIVPENPKLEVEVLLGKQRHWLCAGRPIGGNQNRRLSLYQIRSY